MLRYADKKKRELDKKIKQLEDQLWNQQSYLRGLQREYQTIHTTKGPNYEQQRHNIALRLTDASQVIDKTKDTLRRVRKEYDDLDEQNHNTREYVVFSIVHFF
jgi:uncharacterized coiled-coil protein SlyX